MATSAYSSIQDQVFRPHPYIVGGKIVAFLASGIGILLAGAAHATLIVTPVACAVLVLAARIAYCELTTFLIVRGDTLLRRQGWLFWREKQVPLHRAEVLTTQSLSGRLFDYGHLTIAWDDEVLVVRNIGEFRRLKEEIARLQRVSAFWRTL